MPSFFKSYIRWVRIAFVIDIEVVGPLMGPVTPENVKGMLRILLSRLFSLLVDYCPSLHDFFICFPRTPIISTRNQD